MGVATNAVYSIDGRLWLYCCGIGRCIGDFAEFPDIDIAGCSGATTDGAIDARPGRCKLPILAIVRRTLQCALCLGPTSQPTRGCLLL